MLFYTVTHVNVTVSAPSHAVLKHFHRIAALCTQNRKYTSDDQKMTEDRMRNVTLKETATCGAYVVIG